VEEEVAWGGAGGRSLGGGPRSRGGGDAQGEADSQESGKSRNKFLSPLRTF
jgi:hypothetical protein